MADSTTTIEWTPEKLIEVFCKEELRSGFRRSTRDETARGTWHAGFCAYGGKNAYGNGIDGFDDGYALWGLAGSAGWVLVQDPGDEQFPYSFHMVWAKDGTHAMLSYAEGDFGVEVYDDLDALKAAVKKFQKWAVDR